MPFRKEYQLPLVTADGALVEGTLCHLLSGPESALDTVNAFHEYLTRDFEAGKDPFFHLRDYLDYLTTVRFGHARAKLKVIDTIWRLTESPKERIADAITPKDISDYTRFTPQSVGVQCTRLAYDGAVARTQASREARVPNYFIADPFLAYAWLMNHDPEAFDHMYTAGRLLQDLRRCLPYSDIRFPAIKVRRL